MSERYKSITLNSKFMITTSIVSETYKSIIVIYNYVSPYVNLCTYTSWLLSLILSYALRFIFQSIIYNFDYRT